MKLYYESHAEAERTYNHISGMKTGLNSVEIYFKHEGIPCLYGESLLLDDSIIGRISNNTAYHGAILKADALEDGFDYYVITAADDLTEDEDDEQA